MLPTESWRVGFDERYPIYRQIIGHFSRALIKGELGAGDRIPSIREMAMALKVNTNTIQRAYQEMEREELIGSQRGKGYFVMDNEQAVAQVKKNMVNETMSRFLEEMHALGFEDPEILDGLQAEMAEMTKMDMAEAEMANMERTKGGDQYGAVDNQRA
ncbi:MAG: GntR family transcriptional regulator [Peptococcaceae bacterium]|nr:GntR family transcriptional regulator [Peptococcaceae bacterium]